MSGGTQSGRDPSAESDIEGARSDQKLAAIMTPAANPSIASSALRGTFFAPNTSAAPSAVSPHVNIVATSACTIGDRPERSSIISDRSPTCPVFHDSPPA
jgi:hypothetical protein